MIELKVNDDTFSTLIAGLYATYHDANLYAIPSYAWLMLTEALKPYMNDWMYNVQSLESWIRDYLLITAKEICTPEELKDLQQNTIYLEAMNGNMTLIITAPILWDQPTMESGKGCQIKDSIDTS